MRKSAYVRTGVTVFCTVAAILLFYDTLFANRVLLRLGGRLMEALAPVLYGFFMAYLLVPVVNFFESAIFPAWFCQVKKGRYVNPAARTVSILLTWLLIVFLLYLLASVLLPELLKSIMQLVSNMENYYNTITGWISHLLENNPAFGEWVTARMNEYYNTLVQWLTKEVLPRNECTRLP